MKYGVTPTNPLDCLALWAGRVPVPLMDALFSIVKARSLMAAVRLGVFEALKDGPRKPEEVAAICSLNPECVELLLRTLVDYVQKKGDRYGLSRLGRRTMLEGTSSEMVGYVQWNYVQWEMLEHLEELIRTGRSIGFHEKMTDPEEWKYYQRGMLETARLEAPLVAGRVPVRPGAERLLDIGGSHGLIGATICRRHPPMKSVVLDLPNAVEHARSLARDEKIDGLVEHRPGDLRTADYGESNDVVLLANILHHFKAEPNLDVLRRVHSALGEQGTAAIWEIEAPKRASRPNIGDGVALFFCLASGAVCYNGDEYARWLEEAGFQRIKIIRPLLAPGHVLVVGRRA